MPRWSWLSMLRTVRAAVLVMGVGGLSLTLPGQTRDMLDFLGDGHTPYWIGYQFALGFMGFSGWFWSRAALRARFNPHLGGDPSPTDQSAYWWTPRLALIVTSLVGGVVALKSFGFWSAAGALTFGAVSVVLALWRTSNSTYQPGLSIAPMGIRAWLLQGGEKGRLHRLLTLAPWGRAVSVPLLCLSMTMLLLGAVEAFTPALNLPGLSASVLPGPGVAVWSLGLMIGPLVTATFVVDGVHAQLVHGPIILRLKRPPVLALLALYVFVLIPRVFDLHPVQIIAGSSVKKATLSAVFEGWAAKCGGAGPLRPVIVAVSGGATRSGLWGAAVLNKVLLAQQQGGPRLFAVSSVSGGSLGAAAAMSLLAEQPVPCETTSLTTLEPKPRHRVPLADDALGPLLAGWLLNDIPRAFIYPVVAAVRLIGWDGLHGQDSAAAIEQAFATMWKHARPDDAKGWLRPYLSLFYLPGPFQEKPRYRAGMPLWLANGTDATTGNRVITSPLDAVGGAWPFRGARDFHALMHADVTIATAINNTARFPYLEPAGEMIPAGESEAVGQLVDGGYFENEGLQTALDLAEWLSEQSRDDRPVYPIIVQATGDGEANVMTPDVMTCAVVSDAPDMANEQPGALQVLEPISGLYHVRGGHSAVLLHQAHDRFCGAGGEDHGRPRFVHFYLPADNGRPVPLNWVLSDKTAQFIWRAFTDRQVCNAGQLAVLAQAMAGPAPAPSAMQCNTASLSQ